MYQFELLCRQFALKSLEIDYNFKNKAVYFFLFKKHVSVDKWRLEANSDILDGVLSWFNL